MAEKLRSFLYLDEYKMYSISSQIFEGLTESLIHETGEQNQDFEQQKGPLSSGRLLADIASKELHKVEKKVLYDYAYSLFEAELIKRNSVLVVDSSGTPPDSATLLKSSFVKVTGIAKLNDLQAISTMTKHFNTFGEALTYVTTFAKREETNAGIDQQMAAIPDKNKKAKFRSLLKSQMDPKRLAREKGLLQDDKYLQSLAFLLDTGFGDNFEIEILPFANINPQLYLALLNREYLRDAEQSIVKKYSRTTQIQFILFGMVAKVGEMQPDSPEPASDALEASNEPGNIRKGLHAMFSALAGIEESFFGVVDNEVVIDPIAVYREI
ncbi:MAG: hypothetical protein WAW37_04700 [Syntrophobacteraceae bacterium]